jgi:hypothetical protein
MAIVSGKNVRRKSDVSKKSVRIVKELLATTIDLERLRSDFLEEFTHH